MCSVSGIFGAEGFPGSPALGGEDFVAESVGVACPGGVVGIPRDFCPALLALVI